MARSHHHGKAPRRVFLRPKFENGKDAIFSRMHWGHTQRGRRRHRKLWSRLLGRQRRAHDREVIEASKAAAD